MIKKLYKILFLSLFILFNNTSQGDDNLKTDLIVEADNSIEFFEKKKYYVASGNAIASKDGILLKADQIKAFLNHKDNQINSLFAIGEVYVTNKGISGIAEEVKYDLIEKKLTFLKGKQSLKTKDITIESKDFLKFDNVNKIANAQGNVKLTFKNKTKIFSDKLTAFFYKNKIHKATAKGNVLVITKSEKSSSDSAFYNKKKDLITLDGNVIIEKNKSKIFGEKGFTNLKTGVTRLVGKSGKKRVKGKFTSKN